MEEQIEEFMCDSCGKSGAKIIHVTKSYGKGLDLLVIENVPVIFLSALRGKLSYREDLARTGKY
jgi:YgiT-type zinc finger domain-containing protein